MKLTFEQIKAIVCGAVRAEENDGIIRLYRFTEEQDRLYKTQRDEGLHMKTFASAGMKLSFRTNSESFFMKVKHTAGSSRTFFSYDVFVNGEKVGSIDNFSHADVPENYLEYAFDLSEVSKKIQLGKGEKTVKVYFPWSVTPEISEISLDDGAFVEAVKSDKKLLAFGDSITQGYDALNSSNRYMARLCDKLGADEYNKAIGAEVFFPALAELKDDICPDYITVAYGTNDWSKTSREEFEANAAAFYKSLRKQYPTSKIFAIAPIWRKDYKDYRPFGNFEDVYTIIKKIADILDNTYYISAFDFVPKDEKYYSDLRLHPNDEGFKHYADNLYEAMKQYI